MGAADALDGLSNTLMLGEKNVHSKEFGIGNAAAPGTAFAGDGSVYTGDNDSRNCMRLAGGNLRGLVRFIDELAVSNNARALTFGSYHPGVCQFAMGDGSTRALRVNMSDTILMRLGGRKDGEAVTLD